MRLLTSLLTLALALPSLAQTVVFRDVNVISMTSPKVEKKTVVVSDGKIGSILKPGVMFKLPEGSVVVDGSGANTMRLSFSAPTPDRIDEGVRRLAATIHEALERPRASAASRA